METQLTKPSRTKARYTEEYREEALKLWRASGRSAAFPLPWLRSPQLVCAFAKGASG